MRSLYSGVTGLKVHQTKMDVISNNISNINTVGFKRSNVTFKDSFNQTLSSASGGSVDGTIGGKNAVQVGMGVSLGSVANIMTNGASQRTDNGNDLMINGDGFFVVKNADGYSFTRAGAFEVDVNGNLVDGNGNKVCGWKAVDDPAKPGSQKIVQDGMNPINLYEGDNAYSPAQVTTSISFEGNMNMTTGKVQKNTISFYDSVGNKYTANVSLTYQDTNKTWVIAVDNKDVLVNGKDKVNLNIALNPTTASLVFKDGVLEANSKKNFELTVSYPNGNNPYNSTFGDPINLNFEGLTQFNSPATVTANTNDGCQAGNMTGYAIDSTGIIRGSYSNGLTKILGQIGVANFTNPAGLEKVGDNLYKATPNSGEFDGVGVSVDSIGSSLISGALEMSNVDISYEFTEMIVTQRGFQASSKIISTCDQMIQELVNMR